MKPFCARASAFSPARKKPSFAYALSFFVASLRARREMRLINEGEALLTSLRAGIRVYVNEVFAGDERWRRGDSRLGK